MIMARMTNTIETTSRPNIRTTVSFPHRYAAVCREERNYAALLYHALLLPGNLQAFLARLGCGDVKAEACALYFEYAFLRDLWFSTPDEASRRAILRNHLPIRDIEQISALPVRELNEAFGVRGHASENYIQFPGSWAITRYADKGFDNDDFLAICRFKWAFNIKPDLVIELGPDRAVCIEAKVESGEGQYPSTDKDKALFQARGIPYVGQLDLQRYMMDELLGMQTDFWYLVQRVGTPTETPTITWAEAFAELDLTGLPPFAREMVGNLQESRV